MDDDSPTNLIARVIRREIYRQSADVGDNQVQGKVLLIGAYPRKLELLAEIFKPYAEGKVLLIGAYPRKLELFAEIFKPYAEVLICSPRVAQLGADELADTAKTRGFVLEYAVPLVDSVVAIADILNTRLGKPANEIASSSMRRDKFEQQEALRRAGLPALRQIKTADVGLAVEFFREAVKAVTERQGLAVPAVVVKPRNASGGDGIWLCRSEANIHFAFWRELGNVNAEGSVNRDLIVMEAVAGEEWVVNTVSRNGIHKTTDIWRGPAKAMHEDGDCPAQFVYTEQFTAFECQRRSAVLAFALSVLDVLGVRNGAAHTELLWTACGPKLLEVNPRAAGGLPRVPRNPNQLEALVMSLFDKPSFDALPLAPRSQDWKQGGKDLAAGIVFLRAPFDGYILGSSVRAMVDIRTFLRFERDAQGLGSFPLPPAIYVRRTTGLFSCPGAAVLVGDPSDVEADAIKLRSIEASAYIEAFPADLR